MFGEKKLEAIEIRLVEKGALAPGSTQTPNMIKPITVMYQAHVGGIGWKDYVENGETKTKSTDDNDTMYLTYGYQDGSYKIVDASSLQTYFSRYF